MSKQNVILDLDQTLISAEAIEEYDFKKNKQKAKLFDFKNMEGYYIIFERPGLQKFLDYLFANFNVSIWTAATKDYALFVIEKIVLAGKTNRKIDWIFFSYHCDISERHRKTSKNLSMFWDKYKLVGYHKNNTIIIDDYDEVYESQPDNCVIAEPFEFTKKGSEHDDYLPRLQVELEKMKTETKKLSRNVNKNLRLTP